MIAAACQIIIDKGGVHLTLDAVAAAAGISKGGLLHHYPSKDALLKGVVQYLIDSFDRRMSAVLASEEREVPHKAGRWLRAYVHVCFHADATEDRLIAALGASVTAHATLLDDLRASLDKAQASALNDGLPHARATAIRLACDGLWLGELAGMSPVVEPLRTQLRDELIALTRQ